MTILTSWKTTCAILMLLAATAIASHAQTLTTLASFDGSNGANPYVMSLLQSVDGNFYGTTSGLGGASNGTIFTMNSTGALTTIYTFCTETGCADGAQPYPGLALGSDGNFYGTTHLGGTERHGTVYKITPAGKRTTLYNFCSVAYCVDGWHPHGALIRGPNGNFYGTTKHGGANNDGTVFEITPKGTFTTLYNFCSLAKCADGAFPRGLIQSANGNLYGTTTGYNGSPTCIGNTRTGCGTVFELTLAGKLTTLHEFCTTTSCTDGEGSRHCER